MEEEKQPNNNEPVYSKLANYYNGEIFLFSLREQPTIPEFEKIINEPIYKAANCVLNTVDNFPLKYKKMANWRANNVNTIIKTTKHTWAKR